MRTKLVIILVMITVMVGCEMQEMDGESKQIEANKKAVQYIFDTVWNEADFSAIESVLASEVRFHFRGTVMLQPEDLQAEVKRWKEAFPDLLFQINAIVAEEDRVAIHLRFTGTHTGNLWRGLPASGKAIDVSEMMLFRLQDGKVIEAWEVYDEYIMLKQLGQQTNGGDATR